MSSWTYFAFCLAVSWHRVVFFPTDEVRVRRGGFASQQLLFGFWSVTRHPPPVNDDYKRLPDSIRVSVVLLMAIVILNVACSCKQIKNIKQVTRIRRSSLRTVHHIEVAGTTLHYLDISDYM